MSELKRCPFCGEKMETANHQQYFHPDNDCILHGFGIDISNRRSVKAWNTRKPMQNIVERLEEKYKESQKKYSEEDDWYCKKVYTGKSVAFKDAIEIVKEE